MFLQINFLPAVSVSKLSKSAVDQSENFFWACTVFYNLNYPIATPDYVFHSLCYIPTLSQVAPRATKELFISPTKPHLRKAKDIYVRPV